MNAAILDTTLREGLQRVGTYLEPRVRRQVAEDLVASGIGELEIGVVGRDGFLPALLAGLQGRHPEHRFWIWSRMKLSDLDEARAMGARHVSMCAPVSEDHLALRLGWTRAQLLNTIRSHVSHAVAQGLSVSVGLEDASRTPLEAVLEAAKAARDAGADRIRYADTLGIHSPAETREAIAAIAELGIEVGFHGHDDFGMATANALAAIEGGAVASDASLLGWGERAGIASTEQLAGFLSVRRAVPFDLSLVCRCARDLADRCKVPVPGHAPVVGADIFRCESGLHVAALAKSPALYEPFAPELVGSRRELLVGAQSGEQGLQRVLKALSPDLSASAAMVTRIRRIAQRLGRPLESRELLKVAHSD